MRPPELNLATVRLIGHASRTPCEMTLQASWPGRSASLCKRAGWCRHPLFPALFELRAAPLKQIALTIWPGKRRITTILAEKRNYLQLRTCMTNAWQNGPTARESCKGKRGRRRGGSLRHASKDLLFSVWTNSDKQMRLSPGTPRWSHLSISSLLLQQRTLVWRHLGSVDASSSKPRRDGNESVKEENDMSWYFKKAYKLVVPKAQEI